MAETTSYFPSKEERLAEYNKARRREEKLNRLVPVVIVLSWVIGIAWTALHPVVSVVTGELKARGQFIDENGLDVHRHRVRSYPLQRKASTDGRARPSPSMCDALVSRGLLPSLVKCIRHRATEKVSFDVARVLPSIGPVVQSTEAIVIVVGDSGTGQDDWYERSDLHASVFALVQRLSSKEDCPWLAKAVYFVSPASHGSGDDLTSVVDAFTASYLGEKFDNAVRHLPPDLTFPMIRSMLVLKEVETGQLDRSDVRILPQGPQGLLPNLDLVFATYLSFQSYPAEKKWNRSNSIYYGNSEFRAHPFAAVLEDRVTSALQPLLGDLVGQTQMIQYARDLAGMAGFVAALVLGPTQPHSSALLHGVDALTIQVGIPGDSSPMSIHPHYADFTRCLEHLIRSISNLHERLHHSVTQYTMPSPSKFVSHGEYIFPALLVSLPMIIRASALALRDLKRFQFAYAGAVALAVFVASLIISLLAHLEALQDRSWLAYAVFYSSYFFAFVVSRWAQPSISKVGSTDVQQECQNSIRFVACLYGVYCHAPLLLANYSLGFPSATFWSPMLAVLAPTSLQMKKRIGVTAFISTSFEVLFLAVTLPPFLLVDRIFEQYTPYVLYCYTPLHLFLAILLLR